MPYLVAAYTIAWAVLFLYLGFLARRSRRLAREVEALHRRFDERAEK